VKELELLDWRRRVAALYGEVREIADPASSHAHWRAGRDQLFRAHPQSPLADDDPLRESGLPYWPYDGSLRYELQVDRAPDGPVRSVPTGSDGVTTLRQIGSVHLPTPFDADVALWRLEQYGGGLFLPLRDGTASTFSYGGGRYLLDTAKGADLGSSEPALVVDLNFLYNPSCRYSSEWVCPLPASGNTISTDVCAGERLSHLEHP
jgi:hypothetical protein